MKIPGKVFKTGNSYGIRLSKHWVESGIVKEGEELEIDLPIEKTKNGINGIQSWDSHLLGRFPTFVT
jgi:hypothetical protein